MIPATESFHLLKGSADKTAEHGLGAFIPNMKGNDVRWNFLHSPGMQAMTGAPVTVPEYNQVNGSVVLVEVAAAKQ